jgi:hypothetical protein
MDEGHLGRESAPHGGGRAARAELHGVEGEVTNVTDRMVGADAFFRGWRTATDMPHEMAASGWQRCDEEHPAGEGLPAYRVVYKTLRLLPWPDLTLEWPNLRVVFANGDVERGGFRTPTAVPGRNPRQRVILEHGRVLDYPSGRAFLQCPDLTFALAGWEETVQAVSYVEVIYAFDSPLWSNSEECAGDQAAADRYTEFLRAGRLAIAPLKTLLDLAVGPRLLAVPLTEEVGATFDDWHWNRRLDAGRFSAESQAEFRHMPAADLAALLGPLIDNQQALPEDERRRLRLASSWYWRADADPEPTTRFLSWWLAIEALEMPRTTDIRPVRTRLADLLGTTADHWVDPVGRLFGLRSRLVHGELEAAGPAAVVLVEKIARVLLAGRLLGTVDPALREETLSAATLAVV